MRKTYTEKSKKIEESIKRWEGKARRAVNAIKKLRGAQMRLTKAESSRLAKLAVDQGVGLSGTARQFSFEQEGGEK